MRDLSGVVFRGESDGELRAKGSWLRPYFFAESCGQSINYARGSEPLACVLRGQRTLDITSPDPRNPAHRRLVDLMCARFPEWQCRYSGEHRDLWNYLEAADLYDYEGDGRGDRWNELFRVAIEEMGYDAVRAMDCTDGTGGQPSAVWVTYNRDNVRFATPGEKLAALLDVLPWAEMERTIDRAMPQLTERIRRLRLSDDEYRLDRLGAGLLGEHGPGLLTLYRALPTGGEIRPGDWVATNSKYARSHINDDARPALRELNLVSPQDVHWAGTDSNEFFYMPRAWRIEARSDEEYLRKLGPERLRMLIDGEESSITGHREQIAALTRHIENNFDPDACGYYHGPDHWERVATHGKAVARSMGVDPLVPYVFGQVHDSQREDEGLDPEHGPRAARFIQEHRETLFSFLGDGHLTQLKRACELHSNGVTEGTALEISCWDADRLDLWRVGIEPDPQYLCTDYARQRETIYAARAYLMTNKQGALDEDYSEMRAFERQ